jgi:hypothetical protein
MIAGASEQLVHDIQRERTRTSVRWYRPEARAAVRRGLGD